MKTLNRARIPGQSRRSLIRSSTVRPKVSGSSAVTGTYQWLAWQTAAFHGIFLGHHHGQRTRNQSRSRAKRVVVGKDLLDQARAPRLSRMKKSVRGIAYATHRMHGPMAQRLEARGLVIASATRFADTLQAHVISRRVAPSDSHDHEIGGRATSRRAHAAARPVRQRPLPSPLDGHRRRQPPQSRSSA